MFLLFFPYKQLLVLGQPFLDTQKPYQPYSSFSIALKEANHLLFPAYCRAIKENLVEIGVILKKISEVDINKAYFYSFFEDLGLDIDNLTSFNKENDDN